MAREHFENDLPVIPGVETADLPAGLDRRAFILRSAVAGAAAVMTGGASPKDGAAAAVPAAEAPAAAAPQAPPLSPDLQVVKKSKAPVMTMLDKFYKGRPGPSSSHTIGPMRITYDFYQRCTKLPADQLAKATALRVHLYGSLSATGKCDPVAGYVQVPCVERCAFGAVKSWTGFMIASNEIPTHGRVDFDTTVDAMALTAKEKNSKYKETSEAGLAVSVTLC
jgi:hypothetical protein